MEGITELRDESDRSGMRICIELRRDANANVILNQLYKHTQLQDTFGAVSYTHLDVYKRQVVKIQLWIKSHCS